MVLSGNGCGAFRGPAACVAPPGVDAPFGRDDGDNDRGDRISPGPAQEAVEEQSNQQYRRQVGAQQDLLEPEFGGCTS